MWKYKIGMQKIICIFVLLCVFLTGCSSGKVIGSEGVGGGVFVKPSNISEREGTKSNTEKTSADKRVALTFDDGPHNTRTVQIVDALSKYGWNATFFVIGNRIDGTDYDGAEALRYASKAGNEIGIHGYTHKYYYDSCSESTYKSELSMTASAIKKQISGANINLMRPIGGEINDERVENCQYAVIMWDVDSEDWRYKYKEGDTDAVRREKVNTIVELVMSNVEDGSIILMHDIYESTYDAVLIILEKLHEQGYEVVTVSELFGEDISVGKKYISK